MQWHVEPDDGSCFLYMSVSRLSRVSNRRLQFTHTDVGCAKIKREFKPQIKQTTINKQQRHKQHINKQPVFLKS